MGVSADKPAIQRKFVDAYGLEFPMVPDPEKHIIDAYGAREILGVTAKRTTFLVGPDGRAARVWTGVKVDGHSDEVLAAIRSLEGEA